MKDIQSFTAPISFSPFQSILKVLETGMMHFRFPKDKVLWFKNNTTILLYRLLPPEINAFKANLLFCENLFRR